MTPRDIPPEAVFVFFGGMCVLLLWRLLWRIAVHLEAIRSMLASTETRTSDVAGIRSDVAGIRSDIAGIRRDTLSVRRDAEKTRTLLEGR